MEYATFSEPYVKNKIYSLGKKSVVLGHGNEKVQRVWWKLLEKMIDGTSLHLYPKTKAMGWNQFQCPKPDGIKIKCGKQKTDIRKFKFLNMTRHNWENLAVVLFWSIDHQVNKFWF